MKTRTETRSTQSSLKRDVLSELSSLRDTAKVRLHLLSLDARSAFRELEGRLDAVEQRIQRGGEHVADATLAKARELSRSISAFLDGSGTQQASPPHHVRWLMQDAVRTCSPDDTLDHVAQILWEQDCGVVPVVSEQGKVVGMITDRDICMAVYTQGQPATRVKVSTAMSQSVASCKVSDSAFQALEIMGTNRVRRLPVVDDQGQIHGILSFSDIARYVKTLDDANASRQLLDAFTAITERDVPVSMAAE